DVLQYVATRESSVRSHASRFMYATIRTSPSSASCATAVTRPPRFSKSGCSICTPRGSAYHRGYGGATHLLTSVKKGSRVQGFKGSRVQGFEGSRVRGFEGSRVRGFEGSRV